VLPADMGRAVAADLKRGAEALKIFKKRVDSVLDTFESSPGNATHVANQTVARTAFSGLGDFGEAEDLHKQYDKVHTHLTRLSKVLALQIEAIGIAVYGADVGFDNLEEDLRHRFWQLQTQIRNESRPDGQKAPAGPQKHTDDKHISVGMA
jgi:hypothetical protein